MALPFASSFAVLKRIVFALVTVHVHRLKGRQVRLQFSLCLPDVDHFCVYSPSRATHRDAGFHLLYFGTRSRQVKEETLADSDPPIPAAASICVLRVASSIFQCSVQLRFQGSPSGCCGLSCPSARLPIQSPEPVPCVQMLFRAVSQVSFCLPELSDMFSARCLFRNQLATQRRQSRLCILSLACAV